MEDNLIITQKNFEEEVFKSKLPVLVDFWASWCPPCKMIEPILKEIADELKGRVKVRKINIDQNPEVRSRFNISGVPTLILFREGKIIKREIGAKSKKQLLEMIEEILK